MVLNPNSLTQKHVMNEQQKWDALDGKQNPKVWIGKPTWLMYQAISAKTQAILGL